MKYSVTINHRYTTNHFETDNLVNLAKHINSNNGPVHLKCKHWEEAEAREYLNSLGVFGATIIENK